MTQPGRTIKNEPNIVFIRSVMPRSGTNYLADILACHPRVRRSPGEFWEFVPFRHHSLLDRYLAAIEQSKHAHQFSRELFLPFLGRAWSEFLADSEDPGTTLVWKEPSIDYLEAMIQMFPQAKSVIIIRDARDVISSSLAAGFVLPKRTLWNRHHWRRYLPDSDFKILCNQFRVAAKALLSNLDSSKHWSAPDSIKLVRFEDLLQDAPRWVLELLQFLGLDPGEFRWQEFEQLKVRGSSFLRNDIGQMDFSEGVAKPVDFSPVGRWKNWSQGRKSYFERVCGDVFRELGYSA